MKMLSILLTALFLAMTTGARAESTRIYMVHLYYDHGQLIFDRDYDKAVDVQQGSVVGFSGSFKAEILDKNDLVLSQLTFEPRPYLFADPGGLIFEDKGKTTLQLPYSQTGTKLKIYDPSGKLILQYDLSDLAQVSLVLSPSSQNTDTPTSTIWYWWVLAIIVLLSVAFSVTRWRHRKTTSQQ